MQRVAHLRTERARWAPGQRSGRDQRASAGEVRAQRAGSQASVSIADSE